jgi:hypothetical protein
MEQEKKYLGGWWVWICILLVGTVIVFSLLRYAGLIGGTIVERKVFENSFQYSEARKSEVATFQAQLVEIDRKLSNPEIDANTRSNLEAQASALRIQLSVARSK